MQMAGLVMADPGNPVPSYASRALIYGCFAVVGSSIGSMWTWATDDWSDANPLTAGLLPAVFSVGPAILIASAANVSRPTVAMVAVGLAVAMIVMWGLFASSDSSTSALVFVWGWFAGIPVAIGIVLAERRFTYDAQGSGKLPNA
ncbi:MAG: hypothetical protein AAGF73_18715 [Actinomycetota bacterium]